MKLTLMICKGNGLPSPRRGGAARQVEISLVADVSGLQAPEVLAALWNHAQNVLSEKRKNGTCSGRPESGERYGNIYHTFHSPHSPIYMRYREAHWIVKKYDGVFKGTFSFEGHAENRIQQRYFPIGRPGQLLPSRGRESDRVAFPVDLSGLQPGVRFLVFAEYDKLYGRGAAAEAIEKLKLDLAPQDVRGLNVFALGAALYDIALRRPVGTTSPKHVQSAFEDIDHRRQHGDSGLQRIVPMHFGPYAVDMWKIKSFCDSIDSQGIIDPHEFDSQYGQGLLRKAVERLRELHDPISIAGVQVGPFVEQLVAEQLVAEIQRELSGVHLESAGRLRHVVYRGSDRHVIRVLRGTEAPVELVIDGSIDPRPLDEQLGLGKTRALVERAMRLSAAQDESSPPLPNLSTLP